MAEKEGTLYGCCTLKIRMEKYEDYLRWVKYNGGKRWEFDVTYPAIMQQKYEFKTALEVEMMAQKIVQLLQMGFNVYSANWELKEYKSQLKQGL